MATSKAAGMVAVALTAVVLEEMQGAYGGLQLQPVFGLAFYLAMAMRGCQLCFFYNQFIQHYNL